MLNYYCIFCVQLSHSAKLGISLCFQSLPSWEQHSPGQNQSLHGGWKEFCTKFPRVQTSSSRLGLNYPEFLSGLRCFGGKFIPSWAHRTFPRPTSQWDFVSAFFPPPSTTQGGWRITQRGRSCWVQLVLRLNPSTRWISPWVQDLLKPASNFLPVQKVES